MFGSTNSAFGQSNSSPFGSPSVFGQPSNTANNPFSSQPFGSTTPTFGSQSGSSMFGGTATGVFGATATSSPFSSTPAFGASSSPAFGSSTPAFGTSAFGQKPAFGGFGSTPNQTSPFGSSASQPGFGSSVFGSSTPFGATSSPAFGATSSPAFGATSSPTFGAASSPAFGSTAFGSTGSAFGASSAPAFGSGPFGGSNAPVFGSSSSPAFGATSSPAFGASSTPAFGASSTPSLGFGSSPAFGQSSSAFGSSSPFGATSSAFGTQSSSFGAQSTTPAFGSAAGFGAQRGGSRVSPYTPTTETDTSSTQQAGKLLSISAMPVYKDKTHEELRFEDYTLGDKGGPTPTGQSAGATGFGSSMGQPNPFSSNPAFGQSSSSTFSSTSTNPFAQKTSTFPGFGSSSTSSFNSSPFGASSSSAPFGASSNPLFGSSSAFGTSSSASLFNSSTTSAFGSSPSPFNTSTAQGSVPSFSSGFSFPNTQSSPLFSSTNTFGQQSAPAFGQSAPAFGQSAPAFGQSAPSFGQSAGGFGSSSTPSFGQTNTFSTPLSGFGGASTPSMIGQSTPSFSSSFQPAQPAQTSSGFGFGFAQPQTANTSGNSGSSIFGQGNFGQLSATQGSTLLQAVPATNPFGTLPAIPQMSIGRAGSGSSIQYGISSMPVVEKPGSVRISSLLTPRHLSQRRIRWPARKYHPNIHGVKVPFFSDDEETTSTPKADAFFMPRENPRALVIHPTQQLSFRSSADKPSSSKGPSVPAQEDGAKSGEVCNPTSSTKIPQRTTAGDMADNGFVNGRSHPDISNQNGNDNDNVEQEDPYKTLGGHRAGDAAIAYEHGADVEAQMPKLRRSDYYTEPPIKELAAKERAEPGFSSRVRDFVVGRHGYGSIKFFGETDVRRLDLESLVQFNNREVIVYMDDSKKPPVGQGLNKAAEVTLLNIKCFDKKTGNQYTEGPRIEKYKEMLKRKAEGQGAEFVSYDPIKGEWKFRVDHFSKYGLYDECGGDIQP